MEQINAYKTPEADLEADLEFEKPQYLASQGKRFGTLILDNIFIFVYAIAIGFILGIIFALTDNVALLEVLAKPIPNFLFGLSVVFSYYFFLEILWGRTIGKIILGTKVVDVDRNRPKASAIFMRTLVRFIPLEAISFLPNNGASGWHDRFSNTQVISSR